MGQQFIGELEVEIPEAREYKLKALFIEDEFTIVLVDVERKAVVSEYVAKTNH